MIVIIVVVLRVLPVIDAEIVLARDRHMMVGDRIQKPKVPIILRRAIRDQRGVHAVLLQIKSEMQTGDPGTDNSDVTCHVALPWRFCEFSSP